MTTSLLRRGTAGLLGAGVWLLAAAPAAAQVVGDVYPIAPDDGATVGRRPVLRVAVEGSDIVKMRFRIVMSRDDFETEHYVFDQLDEPNGWAHSLSQEIAADEPDGGLYFPREPLDDGVYDWKAYAWNGTSWVEGETVYRLRVDGVIPADVENLRLSRVGDGALRLDWTPVVLDKNGRPEEVTKYRIYRFYRKRHFFARGFQVGEAEFTTYLDERPEVLAAPILFYKVTAEDAAGNHRIHRPKWEHELAQESND